MFTNAKWIRCPSDIGFISPEFKKTCTFKKEIKSAVAYLSAIGIYSFRINGKKASDALLAPGWTSYEHRIQYQTYDITSLIEEKSEFSVLLGRGWAIGRIGCAMWGDAQSCEKEMPAFIGRIDITYADGDTESILSDTDWDVYTSHILSSEFYDGETVDLTSEIKYCGKAIENASQPHHKLIAQVGELVVERERVLPASLIVTPLGERVIDFGQNLAGYVEITIRGKRGDRISLSHAEVLDKDGNFYTANMRSAKNNNVYVLDGEENVLKPTFSFQGFRYVRFDEYPGEIDLCGICAVVIYSDIKRTGYFSSGYEKLNRLYSNIIWGQKGNFIDVPTDCPQRDERLGWTGDAAVFCRTAAINYDVERFFKKWLGDMVLDQTPEGGIRGIVPSKVGGHLTRVSTAWADAAVICPYEIYLAYGNEEILRENYEMMKKWIEYMRAFGDEEFLFIGGNHYGDWLAMDAGNGQYIGATQTDMIASAYFAYSTSLVIKTEKILGIDSSYHEELYKNVRAAFREAFMKDGMPTVYEKADGLTKNRPVKPITQTAIALILRFGLCEECEREALADKLCELIRENGGRMTTGFVGTPQILHALSECDRSDYAFDLLLQEKNPSWLFSVNHGATTIWEHWDSVNDEGEFWSTDMNSFNHYAYGAVYDWMFGVMLGIKVNDDGAGYKKITYSPTADKRIGFANASINTRIGTISSSWSYTDSGKVRYELTIPDGCEATIKIKGIKEHTVTGGSYVFIA